MLGGGARPRRREFSQLDKRHFLPAAYTVAAEVGSGRPVRLDVEELPIIRAGYVISCPDRILSPAARAFRDFAVDHGSKYLPSGGRGRSRSLIRAGFSPQRRRQSAVERQMLRLGVMRRRKPLILIARPAGRNWALLCHCYLECSVKALAIAPGRSENVRCRNSNPSRCP